MNRISQRLRFLYSLFSESPIGAVLRECLDELHNGWKLTGHPVLLFGTTAEPARVPLGVQTCFKQEIVFEVRRERLIHLVQH